jgi:hypothetical protein
VLELDVLRGVAIVAVVGVHVTVGFLHAAPRGGPTMWQASGHAGSCRRRNSGRHLSGLPATPCPVRSLLTALVAIVVALSGTELALRFTNLTAAPMDEYPWMLRDPVYGTVNVPGTYVDPPMAGGMLAGRIDIDDRGMRVTSSGLHRRRIACLGDSSTFGIRLVAGSSGFADGRFRADNAYPERLAALVDAEVVNAGVLGHNAELGLRRLRGLVLRLHPDVIIVRYGFNDHAFPNAHLPSHGASGAPCSTARASSRSRSSSRPRDCLRRRPRT